jgi:tRNA-splicing ligase RtcB (3'-phosphate/5'-hydroxy nucleic acid ligase)
MPKRIGNVLSWGSDVEMNTIEQAAKASRLPFVRGHLALMPDAHVGMGATIGSVIPTRGAIIPSAVGVDIGCGMIAAQTDLASSDLPEDVGGFLSHVERVVPAGVGKGHAFANRDVRDFRASEVPTYTGASTLSGKQIAKVTDQFGTLGSGNHFVEVCLDERDRVWVVLHSGSRGIGNQLATQHIEGAKGLMKQLFISLEDPDLAYLVEDTPEFDAYIADMLWAQQYALGNRESMMDAALLSLWEVCGLDVATMRAVARINCHHNFTAKEHHHGNEVWLTRKGAISARKDQLGVIPGSMGTSSYIVRGRGSEASYQSSSHGAGRRMSRARARRELSEASLGEAMEGKVWNKDKAGALLDEHPASYKDIDQVMEDQRDLVEVVHSLRQIFNYKGT